MNSKDRASSASQVSCGHQKLNGMLRTRREYSCQLGNTEVSCKEGDPRGLLKGAKIFEKGGRRVVQSICFKEKLKRQRESWFAGEVSPVGGTREMRYRDTPEYQKEVFYPAGHGEPLKNSEQKEDTREILLGWMDTDH